jgi:hypothetical protein
VRRFSLLVGVTLPFTSGTSVLQNLMLLTKDLHAGRANWQSTLVLE